MIVLYQPPRAWGIPNPSPFCVKLETYLRMAELPYRVEVTRPQRGPKGKIPFIVDGDVTMGDSAFIIEYLAQKYGDPLDRDLGAEERARGHAMRCLMEEHLYFGVLYLRWTCEAARPHLVEAFSPLVPRPLRGLIPTVLGGALVKKTRTQGIGRHSREEILHLVDQDLVALDALLGDQPFLLGERPTRVDATGYGSLLQLHGVPWDGDEKALIRERPRLVAYLERMRDRFWAGWSPEPG